MTQAFALGITGGLETGKGHGGLGISYDTDGWNIGAYGHFGGARGLFDSLLAKYDRFDTDLSSNVGGAGEAARLILWRFVWVGTSDYEA